MHLGFVRRARASSQEGSLQGYTADMGCKHPPVEVHTDLLGGRLVRPEEEGSSCRLGMKLEVGRNRQYRVVEGRSHGRIHQGCTARCIHHRGLVLVSQSTL